MSGKVMNLAETREFIEQARWGRLATTGPDGPYITPLHFVLRHDKIYFHCAPRGRKLDNISHETRVCFEVSEMEGIIEHVQPCKYTTRYRSALVFGRAGLVTGKEEKVLALNLIARKYCKDGRCGPVTPEKADSVAVIALNIESISGKAGG